MRKNVAKTAQKRIKMHKKSKKWHIHLYMSFFFSTFAANLEKNYHERKSRDTESASESV